MRTLFADRRISAGKHRRAGPVHLRLRRTHHSPSIPIAERFRSQASTTTPGSGAKRSRDDQDSDRPRKQAPQQAKNDPQAPAAAPRQPQQVPAPATTATEPSPAPAAVAPAPRQLPRPRSTLSTASGQRAARFSRIRRPRGCPARSGACRGDGSAQLPCRHQLRSRRQPSPPPRQTRRSACG